VKKKRLRVLTNSLDWTLLAYAGACLVSILLCFMVKTPLRIMIDSLLLPCVLYLLAKNHVGGKSFVQKLYLISFLTLVLIGSLGGLEKLIGRNLFNSEEVNTYVTEDVFRLSGPFTTAEEFGVVLVILLVLVQTTPREIRDVAGRFSLRLYATVAALASIFGTLTRGIWLAALSALGYLFYRRRPILAVASVICLPIAYDVVVNGVLPTILRKDVYSARVASDQTVHARFATFQSALQMSADNPLFGVGYGAYEEAYDRDRRRYEKFYLGEPSVPSPHNNVLSVLVETGSVGLLIYVSFFAVAFFHCGSLLRRSDDQNARTIGIAARGAIIAYQVAGLGLGIATNVHYMNKIMFFILGMVSGMVDLKDNGQHDASETSILR
jgi:O-antigen ligase